MSFCSFILLGVAAIFHAVPMPLSAIWLLQLVEADRSNEEQVGHVMSLHTMFYHDSSGWNGNKANGLFWLWFWQG